MIDNGPTVAFKHNDYSQVVLLFGVFTAFFVVDAKERELRWKKCLKTLVLEHHQLFINIHYSLNTSLIVCLTFIAEFYHVEERISGKWCVYMVYIDRSFVTLCFVLVSYFCKFILWCIYPYSFEAATSTGTGTIVRTAIPHPRSMYRNKVKTYAINHTGY